MEIFDQPSFREQVRRVLDGLKMPKDSGEYRFAIFQVQRLWAPVSAVVLPCVLVLLLTVMGGMTEANKVYEVKTVEAKEPEKLEEIKEIEEPIVPEDVVEPVDVPDSTSIGAGDEAGPPSQVVGDFSPVPSTIDTVALTKSPIVMRGIYAARSGSARGSALAGHGGGGSTEIAVYRALRWLKKNQDSDGKWTAASGGGPGYGGACTPAMTGLALLTFLAHGETPASDEFGPTVERAMKWLVENQTSDGLFKESDGNGYSLPIATYALCEAYTMTKVPMLKDAAVKSLKLIVAGQTSRGLWDYNCKKTERNDLSFGGWCVQAVKAGLVAGLEGEVSGLKECARNAIGGLRAHHGAGGFDYSGPGRSKVLSGTGALCMQLLGASKDAAVEDTLKGELNTAVCDWTKGGSNPLYTWYYTTQAKFHASGPIWDGWNRQFKGQLTTNQVVITKAIEDAKGKLQDIGYWQTPPGSSEHCTAYVYNTTLCALMLEVYYRHLPSFKTPDDVEKEVSFANKTDDIMIEFK